MDGGGHRVEVGAAAMQRRRLILSDECTVDRSGWRVGNAAALLCGFAAGIGVWWWRATHAPGEQIELHNFDALMYWGPLLREAAAQWRAGAMPLWNPYQALGEPLLATLQVGAGYPLNVLYLVAPVGWAWLLSGIVHQVIAAGGTYALCRNLRVSRSGAAIGAVGYAFSVVLLRRYTDQPAFACAAWIPALCAVAERLVVAPSVAAVVTLAVLWAFQILGGHPETIVYTAWLLGAYGMLRLVGLMLHRELRGAVLAGAAAVLAATLAAGLSAFQLLPTLELLPRSVRAVGRLTSVQQGLMHVELGRLWMTAQGPAPLALALIGVCTWRRRAHAWLWAAAATLLALLSLGPATPLFAASQHLPTGTWLRAPVRVLALWPLCIAVLSAAGIDTLLERPPLRGWLGAAMPAFASVLALALRIAPASPGLRLEAAIMGSLELAPVFLVWVGWPAGQRLLSIRWARPILLTFLALVWFVPACFVPRGPSPLRIASLYDEHAELFVPMRPAFPARALSLLPIAAAHTWAKLGTYFEYPVLNDLEPLSLVDFETFSLALRGGGPDPTSPEAWLTVFMGEVTPPRQHFDARLLNLSGVRFVLIDVRTAAQTMRWFDADTDLVERARSSRAILYENRAALPRAFFIGAEHVHTSEQRCLDELRAAAFNTTRELLVDRPPAMAPPLGLAGTNGVTIVDYAPTRVALSVTAAQAGFVVLTDVFDPGWQATIDGVAASIARADCFFRAVPVAAGTHLVEFRYAPRSVTLGIAITAVSSAVLFAMLLATRRP